VRTFLTSVTKDDDNDTFVIAFATWPRALLHWSAESPTNIDQDGRESYDDGCNVVSDAPAAFDQEQYHNQPSCYNPSMETVVPGQQYMQQQ
jgi:hypothetical protein